MWDNSALYNLYLLAMSNLLKRMLHPDWQHNGLSAFGSSDIIIIN